ncbi:MAG: glutamate racemase [Candidatus Schekmanbacteria bacterium]|nr:glutamate racemase [Candidatus Schekmanbacteria bacterium]
MSAAYRPVGVFDSGVGGLTVVRKIAETLPCEDLLYLGDTARVPYGNKSPETVRRYALRIADRLCREGAKALVVACNTASAYAIDAIRERHHELAVIDVVAPVARVAAASTRTGHIGVIGTRGTVASGAYERALQEIAPDVRVTAAACPLFVPLAEEGWTAGDIPRQVAELYLRAFAQSDIDTLILGCTHYPLLGGVIAEVISTVVGSAVTVLDSASATAAHLATTLRARAELASNGKVGEKRFWMTDVSPAFLSACDRFFGAHVEAVAHVDL